MWYNKLITGARMAVKSFRQSLEAGLAQRREAETAEAEALQAAARKEQEQAEVLRAREKRRRDRIRAEVQAKTEVQTRIADTIRADAREAATLLTEHGVRTDFVSFPLIAGFIVEPLNRLGSDQKRVPRLLRGWQLSDDYTRTKTTVDTLDTFGDYATHGERVTGVSAYRKVIVLSRDGELVQWSRDEDQTLGGIQKRPTLTHRRVLSDRDLVPMNQIDYDTETAPEATEKWRTLLLDYTLNHIPPHASPVSD